MHTDALIYTVSHLNQEVRSVLEMRWSNVLVEGEISNFSCPTSGHWYFSLKDEQAQIRCAMFRHKNMYLNSDIGNGIHVLARGRLSLYNARGEYQLIVDHLQHAGEGKLLLAFEALKKKLAQEGCFAIERKRPLPKTIQRIGVITSTTGAALIDVLTVLKRRSPWLEVIIYPSQVQGNDATRQLINMLQIANARKEVDVLLLTRGGGSLEDLWCFNEPDLVYAIVQSDLTVVSAVGHEIDTSLSDLAADIRAPTPSAGAEILSQSASEQTQIWQQLSHRLQQSWSQVSGHLQHRLALYEQRLKHYHPQVRLQQQQQHLDDLLSQLNRQVNLWLKAHQKTAGQQLLRLMYYSPITMIEKNQQQLSYQYQKLTHTLQKQLTQFTHRYQSALNQLNTLNPLSILQRGFSLTQTTQGNIISDSHQVTIGQTIETRLAQGTFDATVTNVEHYDR